MRSTHETLQDLRLPTEFGEPARALFSLDPQVAYLNHGAFGAVPNPVREAQRHMHDEMEINPTAFFSNGLDDRVAHARASVAAFLGAETDDVAFTDNATTAAHLLLGSLDLRPGDEIILTDHAYGPVAMATRRYAAMVGAVVREVRIPLPSDGDGDGDGRIAELLVDATTERTRLAIVDHVTSSTAMLMPVADIVSRLRARDIVVMVDAAHAPGMLDVDLGALDADFWFGNLHKWAFAPRPAAVLAAAPRHRSAIQPLIVSWQEPAGYPRALEYSGTKDYTPWLAAPVGIELLHRLGIDGVRRYNSDLAAYGQRVIAQAIDLDPSLLPRRPMEPVAMSLVPLPPGCADDPASAARLRSLIAAEAGCEVAVSAWRGRGHLRVCGQIYNRKQDYDRLAAHLPELLARVGT